METSSALAAVVVVVPSLESKGDDGGEGDRVPVAVAVDDEEDRGAVALSNRGGGLKETLGCKGGGRIREGVSGNQAVKTG